MHRPRLYPWVRRVSRTDAFVARWKRVLRITSTPVACLQSRFDPENSLGQVNQARDAHHQCTEPRQSQGFWNPCEHENRMVSRPLSVPIACLRVDLITSYPFFMYERHPALRARQRTLGVSLVGMSDVTR
jgi:hypothetical protein